ncbi:alpha/beta hydrolase [Microbacterium sp. NPDC057659]|uniref:alpha/beta hydrolase n=1 Tax=Microbacterium sp. NPDC057659 TaxID=3346198 RepID=UPI0036714011
MTITTTRPPFDPELDAVYEVFSAQVPLVMTLDAVPAAREPGAFFDVSEEALATMGVTRRDVTVPGYEGAELVASIFHRTDHQGFGAGIYNIHGGGMVAGERMIGMPGVLPWVVEHDAVAVTVEYRLAPEFPDPFPVEDCYAGLVWMAEHADELGIDPDRILITGASAGGGLSAGTALLARDRLGPKLIGQVLICPMLDDRDQTVSTQQYDDAGSWVRESNVMGWTALLGERRGTDDVSIYAAPARATDLSGLPPAFIDVGSAEVFRDEDVAYASTLWASGVQAELHVWAGGFHGFDMIAPHAAVSQAAVAARNDWVARILG